MPIWNAVVLRGEDTMGRGLGAGPVSESMLCRKRNFFRLSV